MTEHTLSVRLRFKTRQAFPADKPLSIALLRLMAAVNDVRYIQKLVLIMLERTPATSTRSERMILEGELGYLLRMLLGHLHEAGKAFRELDDHHRGEVNALIVGRTEAQKGVATLRSVYGDNAPTGLNKVVLEGVRTPWAFHARTPAK